MVPEPFTIVHLGFLKFFILNILWNFLCEALPWIRVMPIKFYIRLCFITNWRSPSSPAGIVSCFSEACLPLVTSVLDRRWSSAALCGSRPHPTLPAVEASHLWLSDCFWFLCPRLSSARGVLPLLYQESGAYVCLPAILNKRTFPRRCYAAF